VFCGQCGKNLPDDVSFCQLCGRPTALTPIASSFANAATAPAQASFAKQEIRVSHAPYEWFAFQVLCFAACSASCVFLISMASATSNPDEFQKVGGSTIGVLFTAIWASQTWKKIQIVEPASDRSFKRKHRLFLLRLFGFVSMVLLVACASGVASGRSQTKVSSLAEEVVELNREQTELDQRFAQTFTGKNFVQPASLSSPQVSANSLREIEQYASASEDLGGRKEALLQGKAAPLLRAQFEAARVMFSATEELYRYASDPSRQVHLENGVVVIGGIDEYEKRVDAVNDALRKFNAASATLNEEQGRFRTSSSTSR